MSVNPPSIVASRGTNAIAIGLATGRKVGPWDAKGRGGVLRLTPGDVRASGPWIGALDGGEPPEDYAARALSLDPGAGE